MSRGTGSGRRTRSRRMDRTAERHLVSLRLQEVPVLSRHIWLSFRFSKRVVRGNKVDSNMTECYNEETKK